MKKLLIITFLTIVFGIKIYSQTLVGDICVMGNSTIAAWLGANAVSDYLTYTGSLDDMAGPGDLIATQQTKWNNKSSGEKALLEYVFLQIGLNDLAPTESAATALGRYQTLVTSINSQATSATIILGTMIPCKARLIALYGEEDGLIAYQKWLDMNEAIKGNGANAITGMDYTVYNHTTILNDGNGNLLAAYAVNTDGIHPNNAGREIIANSWMAYENDYIIIEDSVTVSSSQTFATIAVTKTSPASFIFRNNSITYSGQDMYLLMSGTDGPSANDNNLDGAVLTGNKITWTGYGTYPSSVMHGLMAGYNVNYVVKYNYFDEVPYPVVYKAGSETDAGMIYTSGGFSYNINRNVKRVGIKGISGLKLYNNTFYDNRAAYEDYPFIRVTGNNDPPIAEPYPASSATKIKNNIFYSTHRKVYIAILTSSTSLTDFECDYNVYWCESNGDGGNTPLFSIDGTWKTWTEWRALGYDAHSVVIDPDFINTTDLIPSERLDYGTDLGGEFENGLAIGATWTHGVDPATSTQDAVWQAGAYVYVTTTPDVPTIKYVATTGNDSGTGSIDDPWLTWEKAFSEAVAGDTIYFRGGTYPTTVTTGYGIRYDTTGHNGTAGNYICYFNYPGEVPILDCAASGLFNDAYNWGLVFEAAKYIHLKGLQIINVKQDTVLGGICQGLYSEKNDHVIYENMLLHDIDGVAFRIIDSYYTEVINCDAGNCCDSLDLGEIPNPGQWGTGFGTSNNQFDTGYTYYYGCRAWNCSDQGFSSGGSISKTIYDNCWSYDNGDLTGDGYGWKLGYNNVTNSKDTAVILRNSIAVNNRLSGVTTNDQGHKGQHLFVYNNLFAYSEGYYVDEVFQGGYGVFILNPTDNDYWRNFYNNIVYENVRNYDLPDYTHSNNSWDSGAPNVSSADFISLDFSQLDNVRKTDGSLPDITFGKLAQGSDLIDAGIDVSRPFNGLAPDMGWSESGAFSRSGFIQSGGKFVKDKNGKLMK